MRNLVYYVAVSLDGFIADQAGDFTAFPQEPQTLARLFSLYPETCPAHVRDLFRVGADRRRFDTVLMGRNTYLPAVEAGLPQGAYPHLRQIVVSNHAVGDGVERWSGEVADAVRALKAQPGDDLWLCGGGQGWSYDEVLPYFKASEDNERGESDHHATGGPLTVSEGRSLNGLGDAWIEAAVQAGYGRNPDFNGDTQIGVGRYQLTQRDGLRCSTATAFLRDAPENLEILTDSLTHKVLIEDGRAVGVTVERNGQVEDLRAGREVILSAGAYGSAQILLLSGVGPAAQLEAFGIPVVTDLPVGERLQDHFLVLPNYLTDRETLLTAMTPENIELLQNEGRGPLTCNIPEAGGFFESRDGLPAADIQFHHTPCLFHEEGLGGQVAQGFAVGPCVLKPTSRGSLTLRSADPHAAPRVLHNYLDTEQDRQVIVEGLKIAQRIASQPAMKEVVTGDFVAPEDGSTDDDLLAFARRYGQTLYHPTSTCSIGYVVDPRLKVYGVEGLRVADASVMPSVIRGNTNAPAIMIGEKCAAMVKGDGAA